jgi:hypothetical protein
MTSAGVLFKPTIMKCMEGIISTFEVHKSKAATAG